MFQTPSKNMLTATIWEFVGALALKGYAKALWLKDLRGEPGVEGMEGVLRGGGGSVDYFDEMEKAECFVFREVEVENSRGLEEGAL